MTKKHRNPERSSILLTKDTTGNLCAKKGLQEENAQAITTDRVENVTSQTTYTLSH